MGKKNKIFEDLMSWKPGNTQLIFIKINHISALFFFQFYIYILAVDKMLNVRMWDLLFAEV